MNLRRNDILSFIIFIINPILTIIYSLAIIGYKDKFLKFLLCLSLAMFAYRFTPYDSMDLRRYYDIYNNVASLKLDEITTYYKYNIPIIFFIKFLTILNINKEFLPFISVFVAYFYAFSALSIIYNNGNYNKYRWAFVCLFFTIQLLASISGLRNGMATSLFFYGLVNYFYGTKKKAYLYFLISSFLHSYILLALVFIFVNKLISGFFSMSLLKMSLIVAVFISYSGLSFFIITYGIDFLPHNISAYIDSNFISNKIVGYNAMKSFKQFIVTDIILSLQYYVIFFLMLVVRKNAVINRKLNSYIYLICFLVILLKGFDIIQLRYMYLLNLLSIIFFLNLKKSYKLFFYAFLFSGIISFSWSIFFIKESLLRSIDYIYLPSLINFYYSIDLNNLINI